MVCVNLTVCYLWVVCEWCVFGVSVCFIVYVFMFVFVCFYMSVRDVCEFECVLCAVCFEFLYVCAFCVCVLFVFVT